MPPTASCIDVVGRREVPAGCTTGRRRTVELHRLARPRAADARVPDRSMHAAAGGRATAQPQRRHPTAEPIAARRSTLTKHFRVRRRPLRPRRHRARRRGHLARRCVPARSPPSSARAARASRRCPRLLARVTSADLRASCCFDGRGGRPARKVDRGLPRAAVQLVLQDPFASLNPVHNVRYILGRPLQDPRPGRRRRRGRRSRALLRRVALDPGRPVHRQVPARAVRRPAAARRDRPGARGRAEGAARRRAGVDARRVDPAGRAQPARRPARPRRPGDPVRHPRHRVGPLPRRHDHGDVRRRGRRGRAGRGGDRRRPRTPTPSCCSAPRPIRRLTRSLARWRRGPAVAGRPAQSGCRFHPRCPYAMPICSAQQPPTFTIDGRHAAACWLHSPDPLEPPSGDRALPAGHRSDESAGR